MAAGCTSHQGHRSTMPWQGW